MSAPTRPLVSVITPAFNAERFVQATIDSVRAQTFTDWEMIIVDDCSSDRTTDILRDNAARDARIAWQRSLKNQGPGPTRNQALSLARGRFLAFLDADDLWDPRKLDTQLAFMQAHKIAFSFCGYRVASESGRILGSLGPVPREVGYMDLLRRNPIGCLTVMLDSEASTAVRFPDFRTNQDFALWLSLLRGGAHAYGIDQDLATYRLVGSSNTRSKAKSARGVWRVYRAQGLPLRDTLWLYAHYALNGTRKHFATGAHRVKPTPREAA